MPKAIDPNQIHEYVLERERAAPVAERTIFKHRALTAQHEREIALAEKESTAHGIHAALRCGLTGWDNFTLADGKPAPFLKDQDGRATDATISFLSFNDKVEVYTAIRTAGTSKLTEGELGN